MTKKKLSLLLVAISVIAMMAFVGCSTGTNGNPTELTGTWTGASVNYNGAYSKDEYTVTCIIKDDGTFTSSEEKKTTIITSGTSTTTKYEVSGTITGEAVNGDKNVTFFVTSIKTTTGSTSTEDKSETNKTGTYYTYTSNSKTYLVISGIEYADNSSKNFPKMEKKQQ